MRVRLRVVDNSHFVNEMPFRCASKRTYLCLSKQCQYSASHSHLKKQMSFVMAYFPLLIVSELNYRLKYLLYCTTYMLHCIESGIQGQAQAEAGAYWLMITSRAATHAAHTHHYLKVRFKPHFLRESIIIAINITTVKSNVECRGSTRTTPP